MVLTYGFNSLIWVGSYVLAFDDGFVVVRATSPEIGSFSGGRDSGAGLGGG